MVALNANLRYVVGRSPHGERGLKYWAIGGFEHLIPGRSPHGERGLKSSATQGNIRNAGRSPHGERGLKYDGHDAVPQ